MQAQLWEQSRRQAKPNPHVLEHRLAGQPEVQRSAGLPHPNELMAASAAAEPLPGSALSSAASLGINEQAWFQIDQQLSSLEEALNVSAASTTAPAAALLEGVPSAASHAEMHVLEQNAGQQISGLSFELQAGTLTSHDSGNIMGAALRTTQDPACPSMSAELDVASEQPPADASPSHAQDADGAGATATCLPAGPSITHASDASSSLCKEQMEQQKKAELQPPPISSQTPAGKFLKTFTPHGMR